MVSLQLKSFYQYQINIQKLYIWEKEYEMALSKTKQTAFRRMGV